MFETLSSHLSFPVGTLINQLLNPLMTDTILNIMGESGRVFLPLLHNTVSPTIIRGGDKTNVIPPEIMLGLDGRLLPGYQPDDMLRELRGLIGTDVDIAIERYDPGSAETDMGMFDTLANVLRDADPQGIPVPLLLSGVTDGRYFSRLGIQTYGYLPMQLPQEFNFSRTIHAADERIPVAAVAFGANAIYQVLQRFGKG
jgi:acetylornithine deacetylase/succinyl-diaminopimelate desuccinylase-like protein